MELTPKQYDVIKVVCDELYRRVQADLKRGDIERARQHLEAFEKYNSMLKEMECREHATKSIS